MSLAKDQWARLLLMMIDVIVNAKQIWLSFNFPVIVSNENIAKEILCREDFVDRFSDGWFVERSFGKQLGW